MTKIEFVLELYGVPGSHVGDTDDKCYVPIFVSEDKNQGVWFMGLNFLAEYYTVFDMTPYTERNQNYMQIGFAKQATSGNLEYQKGGGAAWEKLHESGEDGTDEYEEYDEGGGPWAALIVVILLILAAVGYWYWKYRMQEVYAEDPDDDADT